jgi:hypothetical protein
MKSTLKLMFAALFASALSFRITEDSAGGAVAVDPAQPVATVEPTVEAAPSLTGKINQFFESADKHHLKEALLMIAEAIETPKVIPAAVVAVSVSPDLDERLTTIENFIGVRTAKQ